MKKNCSWTFESVTKSTRYATTCFLWACGNSRSCIHVNFIFLSAWLKWMNVGVLNFKDSMNISILNRYMGHRKSFCSLMDALVQIEWSVFIWFFSRECPALGSDISTQPDPSAGCKTTHFQSRLLFPSAVVCGCLSTSLGSLRWGVRTLSEQSQGLLFLSSSSPSKNNSRIIPEYGRWCQVFTFRIFFGFFSRFSNGYFYCTFSSLINR